MPKKHIQKIDGTKVNTIQKVKTNLVLNTKKKEGARVPKILVDVRTVALTKNQEEMLRTVDADFCLLGASESDFPRVCFLEERIESMDAVLVLGDIPKDFNTMIQHGLVPVLPEKAHKGAANYQPSKEKGNAFLYEKNSIWKLHEALVRSVENFQFPYDWKNIARQSKELFTQDES